jgi:hypothetical protein
MARRLFDSQNPTPPEGPPPGRFRRVLRTVIGCLLGAAAFLGVGAWIEATGGT